MTEDMSSLSLHDRSGLPEHLRVLADRYPRVTWESHDEFGALTRFWLDRHMMFRQLLDRMTTDAKTFLDRGSEGRQYQTALSRFGGLFVGQLHEHHTVEDHHYFPMLIALEGQLQAGFDVLDADHHAIDAHLAAFAEAANGVLQAQRPTRSAVDAFLKTVGHSATLLDRHLTDEEELVVPIILKHGEASLG